MSTTTAAAAADRGSLATSVYIFVMLCGSADHLSFSTFLLHSDILSSMCRACFIHSEHINFTRSWLMSFLDIRPLCPERSSDHVSNCASCISVCITDVYIVFPQPLVMQIFFLNLKSTRWFSSSSSNFS